jgi:type I restriction enzyme S subunit
MGKLVPQDPNDEPAAVLLEKIAAEKTQLIKEKKIKKQKPLPPITEDEKPFPLPEGWEWSRLEYLSQVITKGSSPKWQGVAYTEKPSDVLFVTSENVAAFTLKLDSRKYVEHSFNEVEPRSILSKGDFLMNIVGASIGRTAIYNIDDLANINQAVCLIRSFPNFLCSAYLLQFFNSSICISYMFDKQVDNARANLSMGNIAKFVIPVPPEEEQYRIVAKVDQLMVLCDQLKTRLQQAQQTQLYLADALVEQAVG